MEKPQVKHFVKNLINDMGDHELFSDRDFEECYKEMGYDEHHSLDSQESMCNFIKKVINYKLPNN